MTVTTEEIIEMALAAWSKTSDRVPFRGWFEDRAEWFEAFAKLVRDDYSYTHAELWLKRIDDAVKAEREACADLCDKLMDADDSFYAEFSRGEDCARAIRARGAS